MAGTSRGGEAGLFGFSLYPPTWASLPLKHIPPWLCPQEVFAGEGKEYLIFHLIVLVFVQGQYLFCGLRLVSTRVRVPVSGSVRTWGIGH